MFSMFSRSKNFLFLIALAALAFAAGLACDKFGGKSGLSNGQVVATVNGKDITFGDWMRQTDLLRVFTQAVDPENAKQVDAVLDSLVDQYLVLEAAQRTKFSDPAFDEALKKKLIESDLKIKEIKDKLKQDMETVSRIENNYQEPLKKMLLARAYAENQVPNVMVTEKDMRDWYADYSAQAAKAGQKLPGYDKLRSEVKEKEIRPALQAEKFLSNLRAGAKINRKDDVIKKYLDTLSLSQQMLDSKANPMPTLDLKDMGKK